jgi:hypothetical protein
MNSPQNVPPRRRLQELQAIPERLRTEAEWDELHELEISLAPGNRADGAPPLPRPANPPNPDRPRSRHISGEGGEGRKTFRKRRPKPPKPAGPE